MKKNIGYIQKAIANEIMKEYTTRDIADVMISGDENRFSVYSSDNISITFRKTKDAHVTDNQIIKIFTKALKRLVQESDDIEDILSDVYDVKYNEKYITEGYVSSMVTISSTGRLVRLDIDY